MASWIVLTKEESKLEDETQLKYGASNIKFCKIFFLKKKNLLQAIIAGCLYIKRIFDIKRKGRKHTTENF